MHPQYPAIKPYRVHTLKVSELHTLYVEECGIEDGLPILFVHGGPGAGCSAEDRCFFNPEKYRIILFDQRGAGRSRPHSELQENTTQTLVEDMETIREHLGIEQWHLFGGSWGSTLSLIYAQSHPDRVLSLILRGIFLCRHQDIQWFYQQGASMVFPDYWKDYLQPIAPDKRGDMVQAYYDLLTGDNELAKMHAAKEWSVWEGRCATLRPNKGIVESFYDAHFAIALARIEAHYFVNGSFIEENQILDNMDRIAHIPGTIIHGRYDMVCTLDNAVALHEKWPASELHIVRDAGHASREASVLDALIKATDSLAFTVDDAE